MVRGPWDHAVYSRERESSGKERSLWDREVHLLAGTELLCLPRRPATEVRGHQSWEPNSPLLLDAKAMSGMLPEAAMHPRKIPNDSHPRLRSGETESLRNRQHPAVRRSLAQAKESGSTVLGAEEPGRVAPPAAAPNQVRTRTILSGSGGTESETAGAVPYFPTTTGRGLELITEPKKRNTIVSVKENDRHSTSLFQPTFSTATRFIVNYPDQLTFTAMANQLVAPMLRASINLVVGAQGFVWGTHFFQLLI